MLCLLTGSFANPAEDEIESSPCSLVIAPSLMLSTTFVFDTKRNCLILKKLGPLKQLLHCETSADIPRVPSSVGLSQVLPWLHWSTLAISKISITRFALQWRWGVYPLQDDSNICPHEYFLNSNGYAQQISFFKGAARSPAFNSIFILLLVRHGPCPGQTPALL